jgi:predicted Fe-S protein YdhL (DUF1289 family)
MVFVSQPDAVRIQRLLDKSTLFKAAGTESDFVVSPCIAVCEMDADTGLCLGCFRTLDEIARWSRSSPKDKRLVWDQLLNRLPT